MLSRRIFSSSPSAPVMVVRALWELLGLTSSPSSMSDSLVRPMTRSCASTGSAFQAVMLCRYFCTST
ncbi:hypothetical protein D3C76_1582820 [compost metagenome]